MKYIQNISIPLVIDRTNTIIDTKTRVKVSENTIIIIKYHHFPRYLSHTYIKEMHPHRMGILM